MNIKVSDLRRFQKLSAHIKGSGILPSSNCIKFGDGSIIKTTAAAFVSMVCAESTDEILVDEHVLFGLVGVTNSDFINITTRGNKTTIADGRDKIPCPTIAAKEFNSPPKPTGKKGTISTEFISAIGKAAGGAMSMSNQPDLRMYVHIGGKSICAGNGFMAVYFPIEEEYTMVIEKKVAELISKQDIYFFNESQSHYFFYGDDLIMGFTKQEIGYFDMTKILIGGDKVSFTASCADLLSFNNLTLSLTKGEGEATISTGKIEMYDSVKEISDARELPGVELSEPFSYKPENMNMAITPLAADTLDFYDGKGLYYIKSPDTKATAIIAKISK